jgi:hypothetical protein
MDFINSFSGNRHLLNGDIALQIGFANQGSYLNSSDQNDVSTFIRNQALVKYHFNKIDWHQKIEDNQKTNRETNQLLSLSQRFSEYGLSVGRGDSTRVYVEVGLLKRTNDSIQNGLLQRVNQSQTYYLKSKLIQTDKSDLSIYANYRVLNMKTTLKGKNHP